MGVIRTFAETIGHRIVLKRTLPNQYGGRSFYVSGEGGLSYFKPNLTQVDRPLLDLARNVIRSGATIWDIGANIGLFTFAASGLVGSSGHVFAAEPDLTLVSMLRRSASLMGSGNNVTVMPVAVSDCLSMPKFHIARRARASNFIEGGGNSQHGGTREVHTVMAVTIDWLSERLPAPDVIKIDVEGFESFVLDGARRTLDNARPTIICEVNSGNQEKVTRQFSEHHYAIFDAGEPHRERQELAAAPWATLAIPREKLP